MSEELFLISDVAKRLNVPPHRVAYLFITRKLPEPKLHWGTVESSPTPRPGRWRRRWIARGFSTRRRASEHFTLHQPHGIW